MTRPSPASAPTLLSPAPGHPSAHLSARHYPAARCRRGFSEKDGEMSDTKRPREQIGGGQVMTARNIVFPRRMSAWDAIREPALMAGVDDCRAGKPPRPDDDLPALLRCKDTIVTCDTPGCTGPRQILLMEPAMRCVCRKCWRKVEDTE